LEKGEKMNKSDSIKELAAALVKAQAKIEGATKDKTNPHFKSKYADLSSVVEAIKKPATDNGLAWTQVMHDADNAAKVETIILHNSGEWLSCGAISVPVSKPDAQGFGSALTYARRYSLSAAFGVAPEDDDGNAAAAAAPSRAQITPTAGAKERLTAKQVNKVDGLASSVIDAFEAGYDAEMAYKMIEESALDADEKVYLWTFLDSKQRAAIKKVAESKRQPVAA
jgi:hypothetical protein